MRNRLKLKGAIHFNPSESIKKGKIARKPMNICKKTTRQLQDIFSNYQVVQNLEIMIHL